MHLVRCVNSFLTPAFPCLVYIHPPKAIVVRVHRLPILGLPLPWVVGPGVCVRCVEYAWTWTFLLACMGWCG